MSVQFSGGEPTLSPHFLDAIRYAREIGYNSRAVRHQRHRVRQEPGVRRKPPPRPGCAIAYLQFDGIGNAANAHRKVGNLFDVKLQAIENLHEAGVDIVPVVTIVNGVNNEQVGRDHRVRAREPATRSTSCRSSPCRFTGRDEDITDERRHAQRYTLSHLAHDVRDQTGITEPLRDWFPCRSSARSPTGPTCVHGPDAEWGADQLRLPSQLRRRHGA